jgi:hypothetical protein
MKNNIVYTVKQRTVSSSGWICVLIVDIFFHLSYHAKNGPENANIYFIFSEKGGVDEGGRQKWKIRLDGIDTFADISGEIG